MQGEPNYIRQKIYNKGRKEPNYLHPKEQKMKMKDKMQLNKMSLNLLMHTFCSS